MNASTPPRHRLRGAMSCVLAAVCLSGCDDTSGDPLAVVLTEETRAALAVRSDLPSLPDLAARTELEGGVTASVDLWLESWDREAAEARALRQEAYAGAARPMAEALGPEGVEVVVEEVGQALQAVSALDPASLPGRLALDYGRVVALHKDATGALEAGRLDIALAGALEAADALREVGPHSVARALVSQADARLQAIHAGADGSPGAPGTGVGEADLERAERLLQGARAAMDAEDWTRAVRRAYYAGQLLEVAPR